MNKNKKRYDLLFISAIIIIALIMYIIYISTQTSGKIVQVVINGKVVESYNINNDLIKDIKTPNGINRLEIKNATAKITHADCPDKLCVYQKSISKSGESIICIPHKLVIKIVGNNKTNGLDSISN